MIWLRLYLYRTAVSLNNRLGDGKPKSSPLRTEPGLVWAQKTLENVRVLAWGKPRAVISDMNCDLVIGLLDADSNGVALRSELICVRQQVDQRLYKPAAISQYLR